VSLRKAYQGMTKVLGLPDTSALMEMTETALDNRIYERKGQEFTVRQALRMQAVSNTTLFAEQIAKESGGVFVKLPSVEHIDNDLLLTKFAELSAEVGELSREFADFTKDGEIDPKERAKMEITGQAIHRKTEEMMAVMFRIYCRHPDLAARDQSAGAGR